MKIRVTKKKTTMEDGQPKISAELLIELTPADVKDATPGRATEDFFRNFGEDVLEAIQTYKPYGRI